MKQIDDLDRFRHMLEHAREAADLARDASRADLDSNRVLNLALVRLLEIVGEAAARVTIPGQDSLPQIPWPAIVGLRNRLIHGYDDVDFDILWNIIQLDLPPLIAVLETKLASDASSQKRTP